ncbi:unnamed protein product [Calypogeia fissa]
MSSSSSTWPGGSNDRQAPRRSPLDIEQQPDTRRRCKLSSHHHHPSSAGSFIQKHRQRDSKRCPRRREVSRQQQSNEYVSREGHREGQREGASENRERVTSLFNDIGAPDCLSTVAWRDSQFKYESSDLESRFWTDGQAEGRFKASCSSSKAGGETRRMIPPSESSSSECTADFSALPFDVLRRIAGSFSWPNLWAASRVCKGWCEALEPLRQAMLFVHWGKKLKHGRGGFSRNLDKALDSFLKGAVRGCAAAMVDAGLLLWEMGRREEGIQWYKQAADLGDPAGQCNLGLAYLQEPSDPVEAAKWFHRAALAGHVRAQYSLALCLQQGRGVERNLVRAARWYLRAAEGGSTRAMYNTALCFLGGEGLLRDFREARRWMRRAALAGHRKAQFEHGLTLFAEGDGGLALVFLELATRAGETAGTHIRDILLQQLSPKARAHAITCADHWHGKQLPRI